MRRHETKGVLAGIAAVVLSVFGTQDATGQEIEDDASVRDAQVFDEIIVTAQKREQSIKKVPLSITAFSGEDLKTLGIGDVQDLAFSVPGLAVLQYQPGYQDITIRGIGSEFGRSSLTGVYLDEIPLSSTTGGTLGNIDIRTTDLERVEVLKGPQGTLFGESSVGGTIRYITNDPVLNEMEGNFSASLYGTHDGGLSNEVNSVLNLPVVEDTFALRIVTAHGDKSGWIDRVAAVGGPVIADDINGNRLREVRIKGLWKPTGELAVLGMVIDNRTDIDGQNIVNVDPREDSNFQHPISPDASQALLSEYLLYNLNATYDFGFAELLSSTSRLNLDSDVDGVPQLFDGSPTAASLVGITLLPGETVPVGIIATDRLWTTSSFSQEVRLTSTHDGPLQWVVGGYYKDGETIQFDRGGIDAIIGGIFLFNGLGAGLRTATASEASAVFGDATVALPLGFELGGGIRYFSEDRSQYNADSKAATLQSANFDKLTYRAFVSYSLTEHIRLYANTSTGFRSGGFNSITFVSRGAPATFGPEVVTSYEAGAKTNIFDGRMSADIAFFTSDYADIQGSTVTSINGAVVQYAGNPGAARIKGIDWDVRLHVTDAWRLSFGGEVLDAKITKVAAGIDQVLIGDPLPGAPDHTFVVNSEYSFNWASTVAGMFRVSYNEQGTTYSPNRRGLPANPLTVANGVGFLNASVDAQWDDWTLSLFGRNLRNDAGVTVALNNGQTPQLRPLTVGVSITKTF